MIMGGERGAYLDERLDLGPLGDPLGTHGLGDLEGVSLDTGDDGVGVGTLLGTVVVLLDDDDLLTGLSTRENDGNLLRSRSKVEGGKDSTEARGEGYDRCRSFVEVVLVSM
jgi:hypothetical protein